jgi:hypothetical protein
VTYRQSRFEPGHVEPKTPDVRPYDRWQKFGLFAFGVGTLLIAYDIAGFLGLAPGREYPGALIFLALGGTVLLGYRSAGGMLGQQSPEWRRGIGLAFASAGLLLAALELLP